MTSAITYLSILVYIAITVIASGSMYFTYKLYEVGPVRIQAPLRNLLLAVTSLAITSISIALMLISWTAGLRLAIPAEAVVLTLLIGSMSFFLIVSFDVRAGKL